MIKNEEGYADPTYGGAYKTIRQEEKRKQDEADAASGRFPVKLWGGL